MLPVNLLALALTLSSLLLACGKQDENLDKRADNRITAKNNDDAIDQIPVVTKYVPCQESSEVEACYSTVNLIAQLRSSLTQAHASQDELQARKAVVSTVLENLLENYASLENSYNNVTRNLESTTAAVRAVKAYVNEELRKYIDEDIAKKREQAINKKSSVIEAIEAYLIAHRNIELEIKHQHIIAYKASHDQARREVTSYLQFIQQESIKLNKLQQFLQKYQVLGSLYADLVIDNDMTEDDIQKLASLNSEEELSFYSTTNRKAELDRYIAEKKLELKLQSEVQLPIQSNVRIFSISSANDTVIEETVYVACDEDSSEAECEETIALIRELKEQLEIIVKANEELELEVLELNKNEISIRNNYNKLNKDYDSLLAVLNNPSRAIHLVKTNLVAEVRAAIRSRSEQVENITASKTRFFQSYGTFLSALVELERQVTPATVDKYDSFRERAMKDYTELLIHIRSFVLRQPFEMLLMQRLIGINQIFGEVEIANPLSEEELQQFQSLISQEIFDRYGFEKVNQEIKEYRARRMAELGAN